MNIFITKTMRALVLSMAGLAILTLSQGVAKADCVLTVVNNNLVITNGSAVAPPITLTTTLAGGALTTTLTQASPTSVSIGFGGLTTAQITQLGTAGGTLSVLLAGAGGVFNPNPLNLVGTLNAGVITFANTQFTYANAAANICAVFSVVVNPITIANLTTGSVINATLNVVACGACTGPGAIPEPASLVLLGTGLISLGGVARRRRQKKQLEDILEGDGPQ